MYIFLFKCFLSIYYFITSNNKFYYVRKKKKTNKNLTYYPKLALSESLLPIEIIFLCLFRN